MKKVLSIFVVLCSSLVMLVACQPKNEGNKDQEITYARQAYDRCVQSRGQDACNVVRGNTVMSVREYFGNANNMGIYGGYANGYPYNTGYGYNLGYMGNQYTPTQINTYFDSYLSRASKEEIVQIANQWTNSWGTPNGYYAPTMNSGRCSAWGC